MRMTGAADRQGSSTMTGMSYPPTATTTGGHEHEQDTYCNNDGGSRYSAATMPHTRSGHVAELCQDRDDARRRRDGLPAVRAVLQRPGLADRLRRYR